MIGAEPQTAAQAEHLLAYGTVDFPRVAVGMLLGEGDADLHRAAGMHRVQRAEQLLPHRHHADKIIENRAQLLFGFHAIEAFAIAFAVGRFDFQRGMHQKNRDMHFLRPAVDLLPGDFIQPRHRRVGLIVGLLLRHRQHRTDVLFRRRQLLAGKGFGDGLRPGLAIFHAGGHFLPHHRGNINRLFALFQRRLRLAGAGGEDNPCQ